MSTQELGRAWRPRLSISLENRLRRLKAWLPRPPGPDWQRSLAALKAHGFRPIMVFDIGVAQGTHELYRAFPDAHYQLVDPDPQALPYMEHLQATTLLAQIYPVALGATPGRTEMEIRPGGQGSTFLREIGRLRHASTYTAVMVERFDQLFTRIAEPCLVKIDVQGYELEVLEGMAGAIAKVDVVICEVATIPTLQLAPHANAVITRLAEYGFAVADVLGLRRRPLDGATAQLDLMFVRHGRYTLGDQRWQG